MIPKFNKYYLKNSLSITMYKDDMFSENTSECKSFMHKEKFDGEKLTDEEILDEFYCLIDWVYLQYLKCDKKFFNFMCWLRIYRPVYYKGNERVESIDIPFRKNQIRTLGWTTSTLFDYFILVYPYSTLSEQTVLTDKRIKHLIDEQLEDVL